MKLSSTLKHQGEFLDAIAVDELNLTTFRPFSFLYHNLGETCVAAGDTMKAIRTYEKAFELNGNDDRARARLAEIKGKK